MDERLTYTEEELQQFNKQFDLMVEEIKKYTPNPDIGLVRAAFDEALVDHQNQRRKSGEPYVIHPFEVAKTLVSLNMDCESIAAGFLHDVVEDTPTSYEDIKVKFGEDVAMLVEGVTKLAKIPTSTKEEQQVENLRKMFLAMATDVRVIIIKLADRLHNMRTLKSMSEEKQREKAKETLDVYAPLAHRLGISRIKWELEDLALKYLDPIAYKEIYESIKQKKGERDQFIEDVMQEIRNRMAELGVQAQIAGRAKHFYSIFRKMYAQNKSIEEIYDLFAVRIIVDNITECYAALGAVHEMYKPIPGRFKDYIAMPKPNMYQSLHTTVLGKNGYPFEVQIRTWDMHRTAEFGIAAHWKYKEGSKDNTMDNKLEWIRQMLDIQNELSDTDDFMKTLKIDMFSDEVFVFTPKGKVISLPAGACPIDFAYAIHSAIGNKMVGAKINGKIVPIDQQLQNGDIIEILTTTTARGPSKDWLKIVKTSQARSKINQWFKLNFRDENIQKGKELVDKEVRRRELPNMNAFKEEFAENMMRRYGIKSVDDMYATIGFEGPLANKIVRKLKDELDKVSEAIKPAEPLTQEEEKPKPAPKKPSGNGIVVKGIDNCLVRLSKCCNPVPGDSIVGYITRGRGVSVHRADCSNVTGASEEEKSRLIEVAWEAGAKDGSYTADLRIAAIERNGLLFEIMAELSNLKVSVSAVNARVTKDEVSIIEISIGITDSEQILVVMNKLKKISGVFEIKRTNH
ncbi:MAG: bifunctional (p)ppGpp synthetase/guanosine-3',5'-bis(diphosphate) 3'-pyrophosphohydrolase [Clostridia bacterium]|nr:bifunctional (p)ppGpp synthetase/guanosine-3',5'-bis(diphosphate) 3'-pyrophosphohydrolase [Clostridia bacterium]